MNKRISAVYTINEALNGIEISFSEKPNSATLELLKGAGFRWHKMKKIWYAVDTEERRALAERLVCENVEVQKKTPDVKESRTPQDHIKFYYNGIKVDGEMIRCLYWYTEETENEPAHIAISVRDYGRLPRDVFDVINHTDLYCDYFDEDHTFLTEDHTLYKYANFALYRLKVHDAEHSIKYYSGKAEKGGLRADWYRKEAEKAKKRLANIEPVKDPGQPTKEDLEKIDRSRKEAENARREAEHLEQLKEREKILAERSEGRCYIEKVAALYPIKEGDPVVEITDSEKPAFYSWTTSEDRTFTTLSQNEDGTYTKDVKIIEPRRRLLLSLKAADVIFAEYDNPREGYDKTWFTITWTEDGKENTYEGRYDIGDGEGGLINHLYNFAEWHRTHDSYGHEKENPEETTEQLELVKHFRNIVNVA